MSFTFDSDQSSAFEALIKGKSIIITGNGSNGKSLLKEKTIKYLSEEQGKIIYHLVSDMKHALYFLDPSLKICFVIDENPFTKKLKDMIPSIINISVNFKNSQFIIILNGSTIEQISDTLRKSGWTDSSTEEKIISSSIEEISKKQEKRMVFAFPDHPEDVDSILKTFDWSLFHFTNIYLSKERIDEKKAD